MSVPVRNPKRVKEKFYLPYNTQILIVVIAGGRHTGNVFSSCTHIFLKFHNEHICITKILLNVSYSVLKSLANVYFAFFFFKQQDSNNREHQILQGA